MSVMYISLIQNHGRVQMRLNIKKYPSHVTLKKGILEFDDGMIIDLRDYTICFAVSDGSINTIESINDSSVLSLDHFDNYLNTTSKFILDPTNSDKITRTDLLWLVLGLGSYLNMNNFGVHICFLKDPNLSLMLRLSCN